MRWIRWPAYLVYLLIVAELGCRVFWSIEYRIPFVGSTADDWYGVYYSGFRRHAPNPPPSGDPETLDVLLLGGSVLFHLWLWAGDTFGQRLEDATGRPVRLVNFAARGHTTRDSLLKYRRLGREHFDLVIFYHGINDARMNNVPPELFRPDYTHAAWYDKIRLLELMRPWQAWSLLPFSLRYAWIEFLEIKLWKQYVPSTRPIKTWMEHGSGIKSAGPFRHNLEEILAIARERGEPVLLMDFAWYQPEDYSFERFEAHQLDYGGYTHPTETWGLPDNVVRTLQVHNAIIHSHAHDPGVIFVELNGHLPTGASQFADICHFTPAGRVRWMDLFIPAIARALGGAPPPQRPVAAGG